MRAKEGIELTGSEGVIKALWQALGSVADLRQFGFDVHWRKLHTDSKEELRRKNLPREAGFYYEFEEGCWNRFPESDAGYILALDHAEKNDEVDDFSYVNGARELACLIETELAPEDLEARSAARIVSLVHQLHIAREHGFHKVCEALAFDLGEEWGRESSSRVHGPTWSSGQAVRQGGMKGAEAAHGSKEARERKRARIAAVYADMLGRWRQAKRARFETAKELGVSEATVRRAVEKRAP